jgi:hypothetical protein
MRTPEGKPRNIDVGSLKPGLEKREPGWSVKKADEQKQQPSTPDLNVYAQFHRDSGRRRSGVLENPTGVPRPLARNRSEQRGKQEASQPNPGEQEINSILPSYVRRLERNDRELISYKLVSDREFLEEMGWDNFAELGLDLSSLLPKPQDPTYESDYRTQRDSQWLSERLTANEWEQTIVDSLEERGSSYLAPQFKQDMEEYRKAVKAIVAVWRERGLL